MLLNGEFLFFFFRGGGRATVVCDNDGIYWGSCEINEKFTYIIRELR